MVVLRVAVACSAVSFLVPSAQAVVFPLERHTQDEAPRALGEVNHRRTKRRGRKSVSSDLAASRNTQSVAATVAHANDESRASADLDDAPALGLVTVGVKSRTWFNKDSSSVSVDACLASYPAYDEYLSVKWGGRDAYLEELVADPADISAKRGRLVYALEVNNETHKVDLRIDQVGRGEAYKRNGLSQVIAGFVERNQEELRKELTMIGGRVHLYWRHMGGDCPETRQHVGIPVHGWSSDQRHADIAMPDFTFEDYKDIHSADTDPAWTTNSWSDVSERLHAVAAKGKRKHGFMWRGQASSSQRVGLAELVQKGPPADMQQLLDKQVPDGFNVSLMYWEGDGKAGSRQGFVSLYDQCKWKYTFHVPGHHYSAMLKYKLACGQTVFMIGEEEKLREEFWYSALKNKENIFFINDNLSNLWEVIGQAFSKPGIAEKAGQKGKEVADTYLSQRGIDCYMMVYFKKYLFPLYRNAEACPADKAAECKLRKEQKTLEFNDYDKRVGLVKDGGCGGCDCGESEDRYDLDPR